ncbi:hypothetical protein HBA54_07110 [Pelagibius litoralis]|uniref:Uncharacterized protein n=1 Tax=Pelagibius litoralis TaxID=374515 RepID=A0A967EVD8_9PROT|nr:hypothetical protein [Pelagibius litoralis]NIA68357.1 hypothetical protein [Pelagibius litoralis]
MNDSLEALKERLKGRFLGRGGVHGLGIRRAENAICVYADMEENPELQAVLTEIQKESGPIRVLVIREARPTASR